MNYYNLIVWGLLCFSISNIITTSSLLHPIRAKIALKSMLLGQLVSCPMCFGFWVGILLNVILYPITHNILLDGFLGSGVSWLLYSSTKSSW